MIELPEHTPAPTTSVREIGVKPDGRRIAKCHDCGFTFRIRGDRHEHGTRWWEPLDVMALQDEIERLRCYERCWLDNRRFTEVVDAWSEDSDHVGIALIERIGREDWTP